MGKFKMFTPERIGLLVLSAALIIFAIALVTRSCNRHEPHTVDSAKVVTFENTDTAKADSLRHNTKNKQRKTKNTKSKKSTIKPFKRNHLDE